VLSRIKSNLPWWTKIGLKMVLSRMPMAYQFWQDLGLFRHGKMDAPSYALEIFESHIAKIGWEKSDIAGKTILEIGPGDSVATAVIAYAYGGKAILVDSGSYAKSVPVAYQSLCEALAARGLRVPSLTEDATIEDVLEACHGEYITTGLSGWKGIPSDSVDLVFSQAVLEHVRRHEFLATQKECSRVMKPGARASHRIDLRDHLGGSLNNLRFSERVWESDFFSSSGFYTNRIQMTAMVKAFEDASLRVDVVDVRRWPKLPIPRRKLDAAFADIPDEELCVSGFDVVLYSEPDIS
jgi:SAM-dependent methyltransferase